MTTLPEQTPAATERRESPRIALARLATATALASPSVTGLDPGRGGLHTTFAGAEALPGVTVTAAGDGYEVALYLTVAPTDLQALAAELQREVRRAASAAAGAPAPDAVHITFTDLTLPAESTPA